VLRGAEINTARTVSHGPVARNLITAEYAQATLELKREWDGDQAGRSSGSTLAMTLPVVVAALMTTLDLRQSSARSMDELSGAP